MLNSFFIFSKYYLWRNVELYPVIGMPTWLSSSDMCDPLSISLHCMTQCYTGLVILGVMFADGIEGTLHLFIWVLHSHLFVLTILNTAILIMQTYALWEHSCMLNGQKGRVMEWAPVTLGRGMGENKHCLEQCEHKQERDWDRERGPWFDLSCT